MKPEFCWEGVSVVVVVTGAGAVGCCVIVVVRRVGSVLQQDSLYGETRQLLAVLQKPLPVAVPGQKEGFFSKPTPQPLPTNYQ
jgi:hypothetical protein